METKIVNAEKNGVDVKWTQKFEKRCLRFFFHGHFDGKSASEAVAKWKEEMSSNHKSGEKVNIICNCLNMTGYSTDARKLWQKTIGELKSQIQCMWIITDNKLFKVAANTMGLVTKFKIKTANSEEEICEE